MLDLSVLDRINFKGKDFIASDTAAMEGIDNGVYDATVLANLNRTADKAQEVRTFLGFAVYASNFYRCLKLNRLIGSKDTSQHPKGQAGDITCPGFGTPKQIFLALKESGIEFDQVLMEGSWLHFSIREFGKNRNQFAYYEMGSNGKRQFVIA
jgi:zinc D-Ala-D-Ala carboxypeptidase